MRKGNLQAGAIKDAARWRLMELTSELTQPGEHLDFLSTPLHHPCTRIRPCRGTPSPVSLEIMMAARSLDRRKYSQVSGASLVRNPSLSRLLTPFTRGGNFAEGAMRGPQRHCNVHHIVAIIHIDDNRAVPFGDEHMIGRILDFDQHA